MVINLVRRMATSWWLGWSSVSGLMVACHLQKLLSVLSAWWLMSRPSYTTHHAPQVSSKKSQDTNKTIEYIHASQMRNWRKFTQKGGSGEKGYRWLSILDDRPINKKLLLYYYNIEHSILWGGCRDNIPRSLTQKSISLLLQGNDILLVVETLELMVCYCFLVVDRHSTRPAPCGFWPVSHLFFSFFFFSSIWLIWFLAYLQSFVLEQHEPHHDDIDGVPDTSVAVQCWNLSIFFNKLISI